MAAHRIANTLAQWQAASATQLGLTVGERHCGLAYTAVIRQRRGCRRISAMWAEARSEVEAAATEDGWAREGLRLRGIVRWRPGRRCMKRQGG